ncbi:hypothetical protein FBU59_005403, partial [Linderina macrospora]
MIDFEFNWCRLCCVCLTCQGVGRTVRNRFHTKGCNCEERVVVSSKGRRADNGPKTVDFRFKTLSARDVEALQCLLRQMRSSVPLIENNLHRANLCGTCQQRIRRAIEGMRSPQDDGDESVDFRRRRSIRVTVSEDMAAAALASNAAAYQAVNNVSIPMANMQIRPTPSTHRSSTGVDSGAVGSGSSAIAGTSVTLRQQQQQQQALGQQVLQPNIRRLKSPSSLPSGLSTTVSA